MQSWLFLASLGSCQAPHGCFLAPASAPAWILATSWLLLAPFLFWFLLAPPDSFWLILAPAGSSWLLQGSSILASSFSLPGPGRTRAWLGLLGIPGGFDGLPGNPGEGQGKSWKPRGALTYQGLSPGRFGMPCPSSTAHGSSWILGSHQG